MYKHSVFKMTTLIYDLLNTSSNLRYTYLLKMYNKFLIRNTIFINVLNVFLLELYRIYDNVSKILLCSSYRYSKFKKKRK